MENELNNIEKIDRYLDDRLSPSEQADFEKALANNAELAKEMALIKATKNAVTLAGRAGLKNRFNQFEKEAETPVRRILPFRWMAAAAAVLVLLVVGVWFSRNNSPAPSQQLFADHFEVYRNPILIRSGEIKTENNWPSAVEEYANGNYKNAAQLFQQSLNDSLTIGYLAHFYRGVSLLAQPQPDAAAAIAEFDEVLKSDNDYRLQAMWYKGLALIHLDKKEMAIVVLGELDREGGYREGEVREVLRGL